MMVYVCTFFIQEYIGSILLVGARIIVGIACFKVQILFTSNVYVYT